MDDSVRQVLVPASPEVVETLLRTENSIVSWSVELAMLDMKMQGIRATIKGLVESKSSQVSSLAKEAGIAPGSVIGMSIADGGLELTVRDPG